MAYNPRTVPWATIFGLAGLAVGYLIGRLTQPDPFIAAFWGLCSGAVAGLVLRFVLTWRWAAKRRSVPPS